MLGSTQKHQPVTSYCVVFFSLVYLTGLSACMDGAGDTEHQPTTNSGPNSTSGANGSIGSIVDISGEQSSFDLITFTDTEVQNALSRQNELDTLATTTDTWYCNSSDPTLIDTGNGSISYTHVDEDPPGQSTGDSYSTTYDNCNQVTRSMNGFSSFTVNERTGIPYQPGTAWTLSTTAATNLTIIFLNGEQVMDTDFTYSSTTPDGIQFTRSVTGHNSQSITFDGVTSSSSGIYEITVETNTATGEYSRSINISRGSSSGLRITQTLSPLVGISGTPPETGVLQLTITTPAGQTSVATYTGLGGGNILEEIDNNNDGVIDSTQQTTWAGIPYY